MRSIRIVLERDTVRFDSVSIAPGSFRLTRYKVEVDPKLYVLDPWRASIMRRPGAPTDTLVASYRILPLLLAGPFRHKDPGLLRTPLPNERDPFKYSPSEKRSDPLGVSGLNKSGSISRGILFGNNQDLSVNSTLNLELSGKLTDRIGVLASVTDNSIPIQAGGNTAELQDFDRVFIKLFDDRQEVIAGDMVLERPRSYFLTYLKKTKGLGYAIQFGDERARKGSLAISAAISKGKFSRNVIQAIEGVQGPYRLKADDGGLFIIVLSGTERVYVDGQLMSRGQENDYVIDYNTAEVTFTAKRPLTKDRRIVVEFQFSDKNYARTLVRTAGTWNLKRTELFADFYTEQDSRNQPLQQTLSDKDKQALVDAGDDPLAATSPGVDTVGYNSDEVLYASRDSLGYSPVFVYSTSPDSARYRISFSSVGAGKADYVLDRFTPTGRVFKWIAPDTVLGTIVRQGEYAPVRVLVPPRSQQVAEAGAVHHFNERTRAWARVAWSNEDRNTFSSKNDADNQGLALRAGVDHAFLFDPSDTTWKLTAATDHEYLTNTFRPVERFRPAEFERNWNALLVPQDNDQQLSSVSLALQAGRMGRVKVSSSRYSITQRFTGYRHALESELHPGRFDVLLDGSVLSTEAGVIGSSFLRHKGRLARRMKWITLGVRDEQEHNTYRNDTTGALLAGSYSFLDWSAFAQSPDSARVRFNLSGGQRYEQVLKGAALARSTEATTYSASVEMRSDPRKRFSFTGTYRSLRILDSTLVSQKPEDTWLGRIDGDLSLLKGAANFNLFYELGSGLEQRREFIYVQVPAGQGTYIWNDYNGNGLKELNEFEVANFGYEADYIRAYTPTNQYVRTFSNQFSASLDLRPQAVWADAKGFKSFLAKWSDLASFRTERKTGTDKLENALDPFRLDALDPALNSFSASLRNTVYYDRSSRNWSIDHAHQSDRNKSLLLNGYETRTRESDVLHVRFNVTARWMLEAEGEVGRSTSLSDLLQGRNFAIDLRSTRPRITWQPTTSLRTVVQFKYTEKKNSKEFGGEQATVRDLGLEVRYNIAGKGSIQLNGNLIDILYGGEQNSPLGNEMLNGLKPGTNATWSLSIQRRLSDHLQIDLTYNGRKSEGNPTIHVGGAQVRAFF